MMWVHDWWFVFSFLFTCHRRSHGDIYSLDLYAELGPPDQNVVTCTLSCGVYSSVTFHWPTLWTRLSTPRVGKRSNTQGGKHVLLVSHTDAAFLERYGRKDWFLLVVQCARIASTKRKSFSTVVIGTIVA